MNGAEPGHGCARAVVVGGGGSGWWQRQRLRETGTEL